MMTDITDAQIRDAAEAKILAKRDEILREQQDNREKQALLATRDRELDRAMQECRAAAKFFGIEIEPVQTEQAEDALRNRAALFRARARAFEATGNLEEAARWRAHGQEFMERAVRSADAPAIERVRPNASPPPVAISPAPPAPEALKMPKIRDIVLDQLREAGNRGQKAAPIQKYIEESYHTLLHEKTVGMTLWRLSKEDMVYRKGQTWFYGAQAGQTSTVTTENPGAETPGSIQLDS